MCAITGILSDAPLAAERAEEIVRAMSRAVRHRGPDGEGLTLVEGERHRFARWDAGGERVENRTAGAAPERVRVAFGHRRLAIRDVEGGAQPMSDPEGRTFITYNGEIYNCDELGRALRARGVRFRGHSDTEVVLESYLAWGPDFVERLDGMFAFVLWDARSGTAILARDRLGIKPLVLAHAPGALVFASEVKALLASGLVERAVRPAAIHRYLHHLYVPAPDGPFRDVEIVPPGHTYVVRDGKLSRHRYWQVNFEPDTQRPMAGWVEALRETLGGAVAAHMVSDVPVGAFLSGGLDSSIVVALMAQALRPTGGRVLTSTVGFDVSEYDESADARIVAEHVGADHERVPVTQAEVDATVLDAVGQYDQPFADASAVPTYVLCRSTARRVKVALAGDGADELLAGYRRLRDYAVLEAMRHAPRAARVAGAVAALASHALVGMLARRARNLAAYTQSLDSNALGDPMDAYVHLRNVFRDGWMERLLTPDFRREVRDDDPAFHIRAVARESRATEPLSRLLHVELMTYLPNDILQKVDVASMAFGLEVRVPFLDHHVVELVAAMPIWAKLTPFRQKAVLRDAFGGLLPVRTLRKRKQGFHLPVSAWLRGSGEASLRDLLLSPRARGRGLFEANTVATLVEEHLSGAADHGGRLWALLALEMWYRRYVDVAAGQA